jgi:hypothetical protein
LGLCLRPILSQGDGGALEQELQEAILTGGELPVESGQSVAGFADQVVTELHDQGMQLHLQGQTGHLLK